jgi:hypothetical protein
MFRNRPPSRAKETFEKTWKKKHCEDYTQAGADSKVFKPKQQQWAPSRSTASDGEVKLKTEKYKSKKVAELGHHQHTSISSAFFGSFRGRVTEWRPRPGRKRRR